MAKSVIMPALGMAQETGVLIQWLKAPGQAVAQGEPLMEVETDKATVEVEAPASGTLANVTAQPGDVVPVGQTIALILAPGEKAPAQAAKPASVSLPPAPAQATMAAAPVAPSTNQKSGIKNPIIASPVAARMAAEHKLNLDLVKPQGGRVEKQDILNFIAAQGSAAKDAAVTGMAGAKVLASPKARRLAWEQDLNLATLPGSGPNGAVLAADVLAAQVPVSELAGQPPNQPGPTSHVLLPTSRLWRRMADRITQAWTTIPHFYLQRDVNASRLAAWRTEALARASEKVTYTDLLVKLIAVALARHPRVNATWQGNEILSSPTANVGLAVAVDDGLIVPVIHDAAALGLGQIAACRVALVGKAQAGKLLPADLEGGTFTLSNLGMFGVDQFNAIVNPPQVAILAVGAVADRVVAVAGQPAVQPMLTLSLSCDHRAVDGARGAQFLQTLAELIEAPLRVME